MLAFNSMHITLSVNNKDGEDAMATTAATTITTR
jgi:hypothetical protein